MSDLTANLALTKAQLGDLVGPDIPTVMADNFDAIDAMFVPAVSKALTADTAISNPTNSVILSGSFVANQPTVIIEVDGAWTTSGISKFVPTLWVGDKISPPLAGVGGVQSFSLPAVGGGAAAAWTGGRRVVPNLTAGDVVNYQVTLRSLLGTTHLLSTDSATAGVTAPTSFSGPLIISTDNTVLYAASSSSIYAISAGRTVTHTGTVVKASASFSASALAYSPTGFLYAISTTSSPGTVTNTISLLSTTNLATLNTLSPAMSVVWNLVDAAVSPDGTTLYTADGTTGVIRKYSGASIPASVPTGVSNVTLPSPYVPTSMALSPDGTTLAISASASGNNTMIYFVSTTSMSVSESYSVGAAVVVPRPAWETTSLAVWVATYGHPGQIKRVLAASGLVDSSAGSIFSPAITALAVGTANTALYVIGNSGSAGDAQWTVFGIPSGTSYVALTRTDGPRTGLAVSTDGFVYSIINADDMDIVLGGTASCGASSGTSPLTGDYLTVNVYGGS